MVTNNLSFIDLFFYWKVKTIINKSSGIIIIEYFCWHPCYRSIIRNVFIYNGSGTDGHIIPNYDILYYTHTRPYPYIISYTSSLSHVCPNIRKRADITIITDCCCRIDNNTCSMA